MNADTQFFLNNLWKWKCGLPELDEPKHKKINIEDLKESEWSPKFEQLMRNRLLLGYFRYGPLHRKDGKQFDRVNDCIRRLKLYQETGNDELLVDVANLCLCEFEVGIHPNKHFEAVDDGVHCKEIE